MPSFIKLIIALCLFQAKPQDLPGSQNLAWIAAVFAVVANALTYWPTEPLFRVLQMSIVQVAAFGLAIWLILHWRQHAERWNQTATALYAAGGIIQLLGWPAFIWLERVKETPDATTAPMLIIGVLGIWYLAIMTTVLRHALEISTLLSVLVSFSIQLAVAAVLLGLFPPT